MGSHHGQARGVDSVKTWRERLLSAVRTGLVTGAEARAAVERVEHG